MDFAMGTCVVPASDEHICARRDVQVDPCSDRVIAFGFDGWSNRIVWA